jgi:hypothetical protein
MEMVCACTPHYYRCAVTYGIVFSCNTEWKWFIRIVSPVRTKTVKSCLLYCCLDGLNTGQTHFLNNFS